MNVFIGFTKETIKFFDNLSKNNNKAWFEKNKKDYQQFVKEPSTNFIMDMGDYLRELVPEINAIPKVNKSIFRINRDVRFSKDKSPYKTHLALWFWEGDGKRMESSGFYFHLEAEKLMLGVGVYQFPRHLLDTYRQSVIHKKYGKGLDEAITKVSSLKNYFVGGRHYKKIPRGYDKEHPLAEYLLFNGLHAGYTTTIPEEFYSNKLLDYAFNIFKKLSPIHYWLAEMIKRA